MASSKHYFITGVSSGIGKALALRLLSQGHTVSGVARRADRLAEIAENNAHFTPIICDVGDKQAVQNAVLEAKEANGAIDVLIPNAGIYIPDKKAVIDIASF